MTFFVSSGTFILSEHDVPFKIIKMIKELDLSFEPQLELARDIFE